MEKTQKAYYKVLIMTVGCSFAAAATDIQLTGTVVNNDSLPLKGVIVTLMKKQISDTTDSNGTFIVSTRNVNNLVSNSTSQWQPAMQSTFSIFNVKGQLIGKFHYSLTGEKNNIPIKISSGVYLLQRDVPLRAPMVKCLFERNPSHSLFFPDPIRPKALLKRCSDVDTLNFIKNSFIAKQISISSYINNLGTIVLDTTLAPTFPIRKPSCADKVFELDVGSYSTYKVWDPDYVCDCRKTELNAYIYLQVSPLAQDTFFSPYWSPRNYNVVNAWIMKDGLLQLLDTAGYEPGGMHGNEYLWFGFHGKYYTTGYSSMGWGGRHCGNTDCLKTYTGALFSAIAQDGCTRSQCADKPTIPINCVRVNADGTVPPFVDQYEKGIYPCIGDPLCQ